jgi:hypothetical protein
LSLGFGDTLGEDGSIFILQDVLDELGVVGGKVNVQQRPWFSQHYGASMQCGGACVEDVVE